jgi:hypothetical protein
MFESKAAAEASLAKLRDEHDKLVALVDQVGDNV